jgi:hypothetical protein
MREGISKNYIASKAMVHKVEKQLVEIINGNLDEFKEPLNI